MMTTGTRFPSEDVRIAGIGAELLQRRGRGGRPQPAVGGCPWPGVAGRWPQLAVPGREHRDRLEPGGLPGDPESRSGELARSGRGAGRRLVGGVEPDCRRQAGHRIVTVQRQVRARTGTGPRHPPQTRRGWWQPVCVVKRGSLSSSIPSTASPPSVARSAGRCQRHGEEPSSVRTATSAARAWK